VLVQPKRNKHAALKLMRKPPKKYAFVPERLVTDDFRSYGAAAHDLGSKASISAGDGRTIEPRIRICRPSDVSARCNAQERQLSPEIPFNQCGRLQQFPREQIHGSRVLTTSGEPTRTNHVRLGGYLSRCRLDRGCSWFRRRCRHRNGGRQARIRGGAGRVCVVGAFRVGEASPLTAARLPSRLKSTPSGDLATTMPVGHLRARNPWTG
jgi:hypothetical protein